MNCDFTTSIFGMVYNHQSLWIASAVALDLNDKQQRYNNNDNNNIKGFY